MPEPDDLVTGWLAIGLAVVVLVLAAALAGEALGLPFDLDALLS